MTSIAAFISNLAGGAPQDPSATPANAPGTGGIFAAFLAATGAAPGAEGEISEIPNPLNPAVTTADGQAAIEVAARDAALSQALAEGLGLPGNGAEIDAAVIESPASTDAAAANLLLGIVPEEAATEGATATVAPALPDQNTQTLQATLKQGAAPAPAQNIVQPAPDVQTQQAAKPQDPGLAEAALRGSGAENATAKTSQASQAAQTAQAAREGGSENAEYRPAQSSSKGETQRPGFAQGDDRTFSSSRGALVSGDASSRSEFAPRAPKIIQQLAKPGSGQTLIKFQPFTGGDTAGATSPPTLTVNVQAHAASPSPAPANVPHVPVSALAVHIAQQASNGARRFDIRLDPPELGRIEVRLEVSRDGQVTTHLVVERSETLDLLQRDARQLERALQDAGLSTSKEGMKFSLKGQDLAQGGDGQDNAQDDTGSRSGARNDDHSMIPNEAMPPPTRYLASTGLDIRI